MTRYAVHTLDLLTAVDRFVSLLQPTLLRYFEAGEDRVPPVEVGTESEGLRDQAFVFRFEGPAHQLATIGTLRTKMPELRAYRSDDHGSTWTPA